jgi:hypothetical protein
VIPQEIEDYLKSRIYLLSDGQILKLGVHSFEDSLKLSAEQRRRQPKAK